MERKHGKRIGIEQWRKHIAAQRQSGQSIGAYCRDAGIGENGFYLWRKRLQASAITPGFLRVDMPEMATSLPEPDLIITTPNGYRIQTTNLDRAVLAAERLCRC